MERSNMERIEIMFGWFKKKVVPEERLYKVMVFNSDDGLVAISNEENTADLGDKILKREPFSFMMPNGGEYFVVDFKGNMLLSEYEVDQNKRTYNYRIQGLDRKKHEGGKLYE